MKEKRGNRTFLFIPRVNNIDKLTATYLGEKEKPEKKGVREERENVCVCVYVCMCMCMYVCMHCVCMYVYV